MPVFRRSRYLLWALLAAGLRAEDKAAPAPAEDAIIAAKRDYDLIKGAKASSLDPQKMDLPKMEAPAMHLSSDEMAVFLESEAAQKKKAKDPKKGKSENWLVDAINEKKPDSRDEAKAGVAAGSEDEEATALAADVKEAPRNDSDSKAASALAKQAPAADNPLTAYMTAWMTPKDLDLLKVKPAETNLTPTPDKGPGGPAETGLFDGLLHGDTASGSGNTAVTGPAAESRTNPYLAEFAPDSTSVAGMKDLLNLPAPGSPSYTPPVPLLPPVPNDPGPAKTGTSPMDLLKTPSDTKYFPQLKRF
jgi:hypothetical protein